MNKLKNNTIWGEGLVNKILQGIKKLKKNPKWENPTHLFVGGSGYGHTIDFWRLLFPTTNVIGVDPQYDIHDYVIRSWDQAYNMVKPNDTVMVLFEWPNHGGYYPTPNWEDIVVNKFENELKLNKNNICFMAITGTESWIPCELSSKLTKNYNRIVWKTLKNPIIVHGWKYRLGFRIWIPHEKKILK